MDEPTTALDVLVQREVLEQLLKLQAARGFSILFITHDLALLFEIADRVAVMREGRIVDVDVPEQLIKGGTHPYTKYLLDSMPKVGEDLND